MDDLKDILKAVLAGVILEIIKKVAEILTERKDR